MTQVCNKRRWRSISVSSVARTTTSNLWDAVGMESVRTRLKPCVLTVVSGMKRRSSGSVLIAKMQLRKRTKMTFAVAYVAVR